MENLKYYQDIKTFPAQFEAGFSIGKKFKLPVKFQNCKFNKVIICGMGGSSYYTGIINDYLACLPSSKIVLQAVRAYSLPNYINKNTLVILASYSGNTEETLACANEVKARKLNSIILTTGGSLAEFAIQNKIPFITLPTGIQPRLSSGYFMVIVLTLLKKTHLILADIEKDFAKIAEKLESNLDEKHARSLAKSIKNYVPIIYTTDNIRSASEISKIKFNENSKVQCFSNFFPELNHNEMVGFTNLVMKPYFIIFESKFTNFRNAKRIKVFKQLMTERGIKVDVIKPKGKTSIEEILNIYYFVDHVTYYLACGYGIDPEPVQMVEDFKKLLK